MPGGVGSRRAWLTALGYVAGRGQQGISDRMASGCGDLGSPLWAGLFSRLKIRILASLSCVSGKQQEHSPPPPLGERGQFIELFCCS